MGNDDVVVIDEDADEDAVVVADEGTTDDRITRDGDKIVVTLDHPIQCRIKRGGVEREETIGKLTFRQPNGGDVRALASFTNEEEKSIQLFLRLSGLVQSQFDKMNYHDIAFCMEAIGDFLLGGRETGKT